MTWQATKCADERNYQNKEERAAFIAAYSDGYHGAPMWAAYEKQRFCPWPNAYMAGFRHGEDDATHKGTKT
jgi:hypothetical protein